MIADRWSMIDDLWSMIDDLWSMISNPGTLEPWNHGTLWVPTPGFPPLGPHPWVPTPGFPALGPHPWVPTVSILYRYCIVWIFAVILNRFPKDFKFYQFWCVLWLGFLRSSWIAIPFMLGSMYYDLWSMIDDLWSMIDDLWSMIYDRWSMIYDRWSMIDDLWSMIDDL